ncbi:MAG: molybdate ABC transporter substrate-binding protein [Phycisphaerae bacterium]|nr:molybdate ABC transporter substrate-binding protein [Phycisphaerae bacterium]
MNDPEIQPPSNGSWRRWLAFCSLLGVIGVIGVIGCKRSQDQQPAIPAESSVPRAVAVAAAADLKFALDEVIARFHEANPGIIVTPTYGSSGNFYAQLTNRAPYDIYFSADVDFPRKLAQAGLTVKDSQFDYAIGQIVVWVRNDSPIDVQTLGIESLTHPSVRKIAIANPEHAPYGRAAEAAMKSLGIQDRVKERLVLGENIAQTAQFVEAGAADIGIIALSLALAPALSDKGRYWAVPLDSYPPLEQAGVILSWAKDIEATQRFKAFVTGTREGDGRAILKRYGFVLPDK